MKEINATTTYDPACSDMQEVEYTMPQSKRDITKCLMIALDNIAEAQAEIDELVDIAERALKAIDNPLIQNDLNNELAKHRPPEPTINRIDCKGVGDNDGYFEITKA